MSGKAWIILERTCDFLKTRLSDQGGPCLVRAHGFWDGVSYAVV